MFHIVQVDYNYSGRSDCNPIPQFPVNA